MLYQLCLGGRAGGEIQQQGLIGAGFYLGLVAVRGAVHVVIAQGGVGALGIGVIANLNEGEIAGDVLEFCGVLAVGYYPGDGGAVSTVLQVGRTEHGGCWVHNKAALDAAEHAFPEFYLVIEHKHDAVSALDALSFQPVCYLVGTGGHFGEGAAGAAAVDFADNERLAVPGILCGAQVVKPVQGEVEVFKTGPGEGLAGSGIVRLQLNELVAGSFELFGHRGHGAP